MSKPQSVKKGPTECYIKVRPSIKDTNEMCLAIANEEKCRLKKPKCKWQHSKRACMGHFYSRCMREARRHCQKINFFKFTGDFLNVPNPKAKNFVCDDSKPGDTLVRVP